MRPSSPVPPGLTKRNATLNADILRRWEVRSKNWMRLFSDCIVEHFTNAHKVIQLGRECKK